MSNINFPKSVTKARKTNSRNVLGTIPNRAINLGKAVAEINKSTTDRVNFKLFAYGLTATSGGDKSTALQFDTREVQIVTNVDAAGDTVKLPKAIANMTMTIVNKSANDIDLFSYGSDTLEGSSIAAVTVAAGTSVTVLAISGTEWITI